MKTSLTHRWLLVASSLMTILVMIIGFQNKYPTTVLRQPCPISETPRNKTYVAACQCGIGQQGGMIHSLASLQCFLSSVGLNSAIAEPLISQGLGSPLNFSDLFDFDYFNSQSRHYGNVEMVTKEEFLQRKPKYTTLVSVREEQENSSVLWPPNPTIKRMCIDNEMLTMYEGFYRDLNKGKCDLIHENCIVRVVVLPMSDNIRHIEKLLSDLHQLIFEDWSPQDVTVIFDVWKQRYSVPLKGTGGRECEQQYSTTTFRPLFKPSKKLLRDASKYEETFLGNQSKLAIMIRSERVEINYLKMPDLKVELNSLEKCFDRVVNLSKEIEKQEKKTVFPLVTLDVGEFGSKSHRSRGKQILKEYGKKLLGSLYHNKVSVKDWTSSFTQATGGKSDPKYIAALQRTLASRADCMILMGGGNFQALAIKDYFSYHPQKKEKCIHLVCTMSKDESLDLNKLINELSKQ